jgi:hypothetical protein
MVIICTPAPSARRARSGAFSSASSQPSRVFSVTGRLTAHHRLDQFQRKVQIAQQRRAAQARGHPLGRAAHVDVDDPGAVCLHQPRGLGHPIGIAPGKLHRGRLLAEAQFGPGAGFGLGLHDLLACNHLGHHQPRPEARHEAAERQIGDPRQRGQQHGRGWIVRAEAEGQLPVPCADGMVFARSGRQSQALHDGNMSEKLALHKF